MAVRLRALFFRASNEWRDHVLTALTLILVCHLFVVTPLAQPPGTMFKVLNAALAMALAAGLIVLARSWISIALLLLSVGLVALSYLVQGYGATDMAIVRIRAGAWLFMALAIMWIIARAVYAPGPINYHRVIGAVFL